MNCNSSGFVRVVNREWKGTGTPHFLRVQGWVLKGVAKEMETTILRIWRCLFGTEDATGKGTRT